MAILGLLSTEDFANQRFKSIRRAVFYQYPSGAAPLTGILSLMDEEECTDPEVFWWEKRLDEQRSLTVQNTNAGPFATTANADLSGAQAAGALIRLAVEDATQFREGVIVEVHGLVGNPTVIRGRVTDVFHETTPQRIEIKLLDAITTLNNTATNNGKHVVAIGSSFGQGAANVNGGRYQRPIKLSNYTQIMRTPFTMTSTALQNPLQYDKSGAYKDLLKDNSLEHAILMEKTFIWGQKRAGFDEFGNPENHMGGIYYWLQQWETPINNPYGHSAATVATQDHKRLHENVGLISEAMLETYMEKLFRTTSNQADEKLCLCGSGFLKVINQMFKGKSVLNTNIPSSDAYGMSVVQYRTPFGTVYFKTHPLFNQSPLWRNDALFLDVHNLVYRPMRNRDTQLLKMRQSNDADHRKDEFLTEATLEVRFPESHLFLRGVTGYQP